MYSVCCVVLAALGGFCSYVGNLCAQKEGGWRQGTWNPSYHSGGGKNQAREIHDGGVFWYDKDEMLRPLGTARRTPDDYTLKERMTGDDDRTEQNRPYRRENKTTW